MVVALAGSMPRSRLPLDWYDLLHSRFLGTVAFPDPNHWALARAFMETVMILEARRTGDPAAGLDWLRGLDRSVAGYYQDLRDGIQPFLRGEVTILVLPASRAGEVTGREGVVAVPMESGGLPRMTRPGMDPSEASDSTSPPPLPPGWLSDWQADVRGRSPSG